MIYGTKAGEYLPGDDGKNDLIYGGKGNDTISGGAGNDWIYTSEGKDLIFGGDGNAYIFGAGGKDTLDAGAGNDFVQAGKGSDSITLGDGNDTLFYSKSDIGKGVTDTVEDFSSGVDKILLDKGTSYKIVDDGQSIIFKAVSKGYGDDRYVDGGERGGDNYGGGSTTLISGKDLFKVSDINFLA